MSDIYEKKYLEMQKYVPFIQRVIEKLKISHDHHSDNPRKAQLQKMEMLLDLLTNKNYKKIKIETLIRCEGVLIKLQAKIGKNDDSILDDVKLKHAAPCKPSTSSKNTNVDTTEDILGPASPPPEVISDDDIEHPVVIPTERRSSPVIIRKSEKTSDDKLQQHKKEPQQSTQHSTSEDFQTLRKKVFNSNCKAGTTSTNKNNLPQQKSQHEHDHGKESHHTKHVSSNKHSRSKDKKIESSLTKQKLQTVKVVITEPLPEHIKLQHFPSSSNYLKRSSSVCHNNLRPLVQASHKTNEVYSPEELWEQYNESHNKRTELKSAPVFSRLGDKVLESSPQCSSPRQNSGRYTPIPDVLKSPPLSVSDINNLLLESGSDKTLNDISEIGSRRPTKNVDHERGSPSSSFEFVRKKLAQTAKISSPRSETPKMQTEKERHNVSPPAPERIALKYNPHPRQERLTSVSSTDGSECSFQSKVIDPRFKLHLQTSGLQHSPTQVSASNVNVLPAINLSDPRLKKQNIIATTPERKSLPLTPPTFSSTPNINSINYSSRKDPRISRVPNNTLAANQTTATRIMSTNQTYCTSGEYRYLDEEKTWPPNKTDPRLPKKDHHIVERSDDGNKKHNANLIHAVPDKVTVIPTEKVTTPIGKLSTQQKDSTARNQKLTPHTAFVVPNPPQSGSEEDWDSEPEVSNVKQTPLTADTPESPVNKSPLESYITPYHTKISPKVYVNPKHSSTASIPLIPTVQIPYPQSSSYSKVGLNNHTQNPILNNRFNSVLNDKSERVKYLEAKKLKTIEPRTYKEFREAKERALAKEAAIKKAADDAEAKKRANALKETHKDKKMTEITNDENDTKEKQKTNDTSKKAEDDKKEKKPHHHKKLTAVESTLDKMYRTQNFNSNFPKPNTSFKIPKKKTEEKTKDEIIKTNEEAAEETHNKSKAKFDDKTKNNQIQSSTNKIKSTPHESSDKAKTNICNKDDLETLQTEPVTTKQLKTIPSDTTHKKHTTMPTLKDSTATKEKIVHENIKDNSDNKPTSEAISSTTTKQTARGNNKEEEKQDNKEKSKEEGLSENNLPTLAVDDDDKMSMRDPRCRPKATLQTAEDDVKEKQEEDLPKQTDNSKAISAIVITSTANQLVPKPQQNLDKFNQLTQESILTHKPQRILQRRNTMVVFDSAPLVDKEKLKKANALLFEDVQEEEKRKRKQAEEDRLIARRNKNLEEMFKKTDDNCTVSTQNIITGKRRTRATINFNETVNAINVFKHKTMKDSSLDNSTTTSPAAPGNNKARLNFKIKIKNMSLPDAKRNESEDDTEADSDDDNVTLGTLLKKENKTKESVKETKEIQSVAKTKISKEIKLKKETKTLESETETITNKKRATTNGKSSSNNNNTNAFKDVQSAKDKNGDENDNDDVRFKPIQNDEHQNCAVSSTSADICTAEERTSTSTSTSINRPFKKETDDNEPTSTASKSSNPTPTPEPNEPVLNEIVDQILTPNDNREHILGLLGQVLSEEKLELIKSLIESSSKQNEDKQSEAVAVTKMTTSQKNNDNNLKHDENEEDVELDRQPLKFSKAIGDGKKMTVPKKKRSELDRLNEDIRDMFICNGVITATGRRMCTIMGKDVASSSSKKSIKESISKPVIEEENTSKRKEEMIKPLVTTRNLRRSTRSCKIIDDNEDNESIVSRTTEESSIDDLIATTDTSNATDTTAQRKMPILKPHSPIKIPAEVIAKESGLKNKSDGKSGTPKKKAKMALRENAESEEKESEPEAETQVANHEKVGNNKKHTAIKNTNIHWHNQSKYTTWCMICEKRILVNSSSVHYKTHHRENYIARMAPVLVQQFKQGKLNQPLFGVKKAQKQQTSWFYRCPFCLKYFNTSMPLWLEHFQNHTVEFRYECSKCHRCSNRKLTISRHIKSCEGATIINSPVKLNVPINAHVCHLCNFIQLKRDNLERHYIEQHNLEKKTVDLLGHTIKLFDIENVECISEKDASERESAAWKSIEENEQVIDIDDDEISCTTSNNDTTRIEENVSEIREKKSTEETNEKDETQQMKETEGALKNNSAREIKSLQVPVVKVLNSADAQKLNDKTTHKEKTTNDESTLNNKDETERADHVEKIKKTIKLQNEKQSRDAKMKKDTVEQQNKQTIKNQNSTMKTENRKVQVSETESKDLEVVNQETVIQDLQDELLILAAKAAATEDENQMNAQGGDSNAQRQTSSSTDNTTSENTPAKEIINQQPFSQTQTSMSNIISSSIDMIYRRTYESSEIQAPSTYTEKSFELTEKASNVFMPTRDENNYSPTIQILAQSIINIEEQDTDKVNDKPITMAERISQRFRDLQSDSTTLSAKCNATVATTKNSNENAFEKLINDTLLELTKEKDGVTINSNNQTADKTADEGHRKENAFEKLFNETVLEIENDNETHIVDNQMIEEKVKDQPQTRPINIISDDEDWEDIEITETAPTASTPAAAVAMQKSKNKGLFQKFGIFKGNNTKAKKHLTPMVFLPKKKTKEKPSQVSTTLSHPSTPTTTTVAISKGSETTSTTSNSHGFKPVCNIMDGLFPDSPCNDPIDLVPELAPLEPLQDLNDISSILDSNLSAVNINAADNHTSIEDALDFISEQQANDKHKSNSSAFSLMPNQSKTTINNISHVGFSSQSVDGCGALKFYCLLQNCSFLYSSDSIGLENHFMCEHSQIKWNGYCLMCQSQCFPNSATEERSISQEIRHMMEKHANKSALDLNADSTSSSHENEERPKIKLRRLTGDCLSRATPENVASSSDNVDNISTTNVTTPLTLLGALLVAKPKPPTKEMPPQPQMPLTEPILLDDSTAVPPTPLAITNVSSDFLITSVTSANQVPLQIANVISLNNKIQPPTTQSEQIQIPKISDVRTLAPKAASLWTQQIEKDRHELAEAADESAEVSRILANASKPSTNPDVATSNNDSPVIVAETVPLAQSTTGDFVVTQTVSAQYNDFSSTAVGFNISIATSTASEKTNPEPTATSSAAISSRQYKCMGTGCKFVSRVPVAMSDHLRFHERRNFCAKRDYLICGFCFYCASDVEDYMKHANQFHIVNKGAVSLPASTASETDTASSLTKKLHNILNNSGSLSTHSRYPNQNQLAQVQDSQEVYLKKLRDTIDEIVGPTGLADDKLYRCVVKNCHSPLTESNFLNHIMYHISTIGANPNNFIFKCPHCTAQYHRAAGIKAHIKNHARDRYFCYLCDETSTNPGQLLKHFSEKHWHTLNMYTKELLPPKVSADGLDAIIDSSYYVAYTQDLNDEEVRKFGEKLILEWQRKKSGSKTHFKSTEIDLLPLSAIFQRQVNCGECEYKTKVRTNMFRHLLMHKQNPSLGNKSGASKVCSVDPVNPVPCLNSSERFFDKMTNLASSSLIPSSSNAASSGTKSTFKLRQGFVEENKRYACGCPGCNYHTISEDLFRTHLSTLHSTATLYSCTFCKEEICKRGIIIDRIMNHTRFHGTTIYRCEECNYVHHLRYVVERHVNERHSTMKVNIVTHNRSVEDSVEGSTTTVPFAGKKYKETSEVNQTPPTSNTCTRSTNSDSSAQKTMATYGNSSKSKMKWVCDMCGQRTATLGQIQTHCQQQHSVKHQYKCVHCDFGSQQISQILHHIDEKHSGKTRQAHYMYHKTVNSGDEATADTRPLWQRNDPTRIRHIRGILMEDEDESEEYRKKLALTEDGDDDSNDGHVMDVEENEDDTHIQNYISGYEFVCFHCSFTTQTFEDLKNQHYMQKHNCEQETAKPFWYRLQRRLCCPECRTFLGNYIELQHHLQRAHKKCRFYAADIRMSEYDDTSHRILCGYCPFHCANVENLYKHHIKAQHWPQDIRIDNNEQIMEILTLGQPDPSYQCSLCADIFPNRVSIVQHACNIHAGEDSFSCRELSNSLIYRCNSCCFTSTTEVVLLRHSIDHYSRFRICCFCKLPQGSFNNYMQHCYAEHKNDILKFRTIYPETEIKRFLLQTLLIFPSGLVLNKRNLLNTKYGKTDIIEELYEDIYKISQQPPIPRLSIARLVARKSIEAQQKNGDNSFTSQQDDILEAMQQRPKRISERRCTVAHQALFVKPKSTIGEDKHTSGILKRRTTVDNDQQMPAETHIAPLTPKKISKRRSTVAVGHDTLFSSNLISSSTNTLLTETECAGKKRKISPTSGHTCPAKHFKPEYSLTLDRQPFSFYGQTPEPIDLSKVYTKVAIGGIKTPLTIDKFKLLFDINCQLRLTKCDEDSQLLGYNDYKHIKTACPASQKLRHFKLMK